MGPLRLPESLALRAVVQWGAFTRQQAIEAGLTSDEICRRLRCGQLTALRRGVYVRTEDIPDPETDPRGHHLLQATARWLVVDGDVAISHTSAAAVFGWRLLDGPPVEPQLTVARLPGTPPTKRRGLFEASLPPSDRVSFGPEVVVTSPARSLADCVRHLGRDAALVVADSALASAVPRADVLEVLGRCERWPGVLAARDVMLFADPRAESALESLARQWFLEQGLPPPELQARLHRDGRFLGRVDFFWPDVRTACEVDGRLKYEDAAPSPERRPGQERKANPLFAEKKREDMLRNAGAEVVRGYWSDGADRGAALAGRLREAFERGAARTDPPRYQVTTTPVLTA